MSYLLFRMVAQRVWLQRSALRMTRKILTNMDQAFNIERELPRRMAELQPVFGVYHAAREERMNKDIIGRAIGAASLAFGITDMVLGRKLGRGIGAGEKMGGRLFQI